MLRLRLGLGVGVGITCACVGARVVVDLHVGFLRFSHCFVALFSWQYNESELSQSVLFNSPLKRSLAQYCALIVQSCY